MVKEWDWFINLILQDNSHCPREEVLIGQRVREICHLLIIESCHCPREKEEIVLIGQRFIAFNWLELWLSYILANATLSLYKFMYNTQINDQNLLGSECI